ncbi:MULTISPECIES: MotA/TolQ/ExbB proton channel family protein [unclassified Vibrio]|uniref:MotA/TolQ/ExbB proton channel family protein n=1 Tax=Vibrio sp. HB236076 TaxID=3232307 RepID=A0AB39HIX3_9VIBR|nr:MotA/TolQ/ExbB proton channel family protein [Vibrio sp. HB161653]MDP5252948.1 MotA/TolQ/ExbB proton channel family protein [Vibrio sp. HB161653]
MKKASLTMLALSALLLSANSSADLVSKATENQQQTQAHNREREQNFAATEKALLAQKKQLQQQRDQLQRNIDTLSDTLGDNEKQLAQLQQELNLASGSLGELFGVVRQHGKEVKNALTDAVTTIDTEHSTEVIDRIVAAETLPTMTQLTDFWQVLSEQITRSGQVHFAEVNFVDGKGNIAPVNAATVGNFALVTPQGVAEWQAKTQQARLYEQLPARSLTLETLTEPSQSPVVALLDPTKGELFAQLKNKPTLTDRLVAAGGVGKVILALLVVGLVIALYRGFVLLKTRQSIVKQLKNPQSPQDNPLGRVLSVYQAEQQRSVEALELRMLETIVDEQAELEKGLSMLKLLAALAPMLGLLGTVTGMIETFQVITQFGNGDPKVMAGGISMALITTVLGLISAIPLLLAHNLLSSQAQALRHILEKQGIGLVAEQAEANDSKMAGMKTA